MPDRQPEGTAADRQRVAARPPLARPIAEWWPRWITFTGLEIVSFCHSCIYLSLLICAFALGNPQPETFVLGLAHGLIWIAMSLICIAAARARVLPFWLAVTVAVLGGLGPFCGTVGFVIEQRRRARHARADHAAVLTTDLHAG